MVDVKSWTLTTKLLILISLALIAAIVVYSVFFTKNQATQTFLTFPKATIEMQNSDGEKITIKVRIGNADANLSGLKPSLIKQDLPLYAASNYPATSGHRVEKLPAPVDVALFSGDGELLEIYDVPAKTVANCDPEREYQFAIVARDGYFSDKGISKDKYNELLVDTLGNIGQP